MHPVKEAPIGIFDSGIGGLSIAKALKEKLPKERFIYFGDTAHLPYGDKSAESIEHYTSVIATFLSEKGCKALVVACNSASSVLPNISNLPFQADLIFNVIDPVVEEVVKKQSLKKIGLIGTKKTVKSGIYENRILALDPQRDVTSLATPLLAPMIEEGFINDQISTTIIKAYLDYPDFQNIDAMILGCTHYPLISHQIRTHFGERVQLFDACKNGLSERLVSVLNRKKLLAANHSSAEDLFFVSDYTPSFEKTARMFFGAQIHLEKTDIWD